MEKTAHLLPDSNMESLPVLPAAADGDGALAEQASPNAAGGETVNVPPRKAAEAGSDLASRVFSSMLKYVIQPDDPAYPLFVQMGIESLRRCEPRDAVEEMLVAQMLWTHARIAFLSKAGMHQKHFKWTEAFNEGADRAAELFRRQMLALAEYRRPKRRSFTAISQANIVGQQLIGNSGRRRKIRYRDADQP